MKIFVASLLLCGTTVTRAQTSGPLPAEKPSAHFVSAVQFAIQEDSAPLLRRSHRVVREGFKESIDGFPALHAAPIDIRVSGNEVVFYISSDHDVRALMQQAVAMMIQNLNGRVRGKGRTSFYRTDLPQPLGGYLDIVDDSHSGIVSITARRVMLRDLLGQLPEQSYVIPGECAEKKVDWAFESQPGTARSVDRVMKELGALYGLTVEKRHHTHFFTGDCAGPGPAPVDDVLVRYHDRTADFPGFAERRHPSMIQQVYFPVPRLSQ